MQWEVEKGQTLQEAAGHTQGEVREGPERCQPWGGHNLDALQTLHFGDFSGDSLTQP